jgi:DMSO/TMAO reductase YedYZ molybdopterin-dependent catalytic subunit
LAGLPFVPFDTFDWLARVLPGSLVTTGIDSMVSVIRSLGIEEISSTAKGLEQAMAVALALLVGAVLSAISFWGARRWDQAREEDVHWLVWGSVLGLGVGVCLLLVSLDVNRTATAGPVPSSLWILAVCLGWGGGLGWVYRRLSGGARASGATPGAVSVASLDRRRFVVRVGGAVAVITVTGGGVGAWLESRKGKAASGNVDPPWSADHPLPNADARVQPVRGTRPELTPVKDHYQIDINTRPPSVDVEGWRLRIGGLSDRPGDWTLSDLRNGYEPLHQFVTLACISNPVGGSLVSTQRWTGVPLRRLLEEVGPQATATHLRIRSVDDFFEVVALDDVMADERIMLAYAWDGLPLPPEHGFPLRIYIPDRYGMKQPKWIESIELMDHAEEGYWVRRGWDREARMKATSVIDVVAVSEAGPGAGGDGVVPVGGIARAGDRGISRVEIRVDDGPWEEARLREPLSDKTWVLWRYAWTFQPGAHTLTVRCAEGDGTPQIAEPSPVSPSGATGLHHADVEV